MILSFKKRFVQPILEGVKIHTIREDKHDRWKSGMKIHFATGVRTKNYKQFAEKVCLGVQEIYIEFNAAGALVMIDGNVTSAYEKYNLALNDGFNDFGELKMFFNTGFKGRIIHWTALRYLGYHNSVVHISAER